MFFASIRAERMVDPFDRIISCDAFLMKKVQEEMMTRTKKNLCIINTLT